TERRPRRTCAWRIEPAARTCTSKLSPTAAPASASRRTATSSRGESSRSFTISCPRRAVVRQCTLRSDSPCSYSRTLCSSKALAEPAHLVHEDDRDRQHASLGLELEVDAQVLPLELLVRARRADEAHRLLRETHGRPREEDDEEQAGRDRVQRHGAERPRGDV